ncbi:MAG: HAMP domain-containing protein [Acidobacteriota bacterium]|nr:HAMP domain-containing protein [Acidobacteriota bacterium]
MRIPRSPSLAWKILLSTSLAITALMGAAAWLIQSQTRTVLNDNLRRELEGSSQAYEALWQSRADTLRSVSLVLSTMSDVRAAFQTNDRATIRDTASEIWAKATQSNALFLVTDPHGEVIASLGGGATPGSRLQAVHDAAPRFPAQSAGFALESGRLYEMVITPVYVQAQHGPGLINVLAAGFPVDESVARELREKTGGSDFIFAARGSVIASTLPAPEASEIAARYRTDGVLQDVRTAGTSVIVRGSRLLTVGGADAGELLIVQSLAAVVRSMDALERHLLSIWVGALIAGLALSALLAHRLLKPIAELDRAAGMIARQQYSTRVPEGAPGELGRLARTFNNMCQSIQNARDELVRQERISTIGRLSSSIVHDLRNPLAAIYGGAEMIVDGNLNEAQLKRVAGNIHRSSRAVDQMLQDLVNVSRGRLRAPELCRLSEVISAAIDAEAAAAEKNRIVVSADVDGSIELHLERARMERVFLNLVGNAVEAMPAGGKIDISAHHANNGVLVSIEDTGPGIPASVKRRLFQPFETAGKNGLGLGLALSRQTVLDHGGDLWLEEKSSRGARFCMRLPFRAEDSREPSAGPA